MGMMRTTGWTTLILLVGFWILFLPTGLVIAQQDDALDEIRRLRQQRSFDQVKTRVALIKAKLGAADFALLIQLELEWMRSETTRAFERPESSRTKSYQRIMAHAVEIEEEHPSNPNLILIEVQKALTALQFGELIRREIEAGLTDELQLKEGFELLRVASRQLDFLDNKLELMIPSASRKTVNSKLTQRELISLQNQVRYQKVRSKINRGLLYSKKESGNRVAVLSSARDELRKVIPVIEKIDPSWWQARRELSMCLREIGEFKAALRLMDSVPLGEAPAAIQLEFRAEAIKIFLAEGDWRRAEKLIASGRQMEGTVSPDLDFAILEYYLKKMKASPVQDQTEIQKTAVSIVNAIEQQHGAYWGRKSNLALVNAIRKVSRPSSSAALIRVAQDAYRRKDFEAAVESFEKAGQAARNEKQRKLELELRFQAIIIHRQQRQHLEVYRKSQILSRDFYDTSRASVVHLVGILSAAELVRAEELDLKEYLKSINYHLETWANQPSVAQVALFRGDLQFARNEFFSAALSYRMSVGSLIGIEGVIDLDRFEKLMDRLVKTFEKINATKKLENKLPEFREKFSGKDFFARVIEKTSDLESSLNGWTSYALEIDRALLPNVLHRLKNEPQPSGKLRVKLIRVSVFMNDKPVLGKLNQQLEILKEAEVDDLMQGWTRDWKVGDPRIRSLIAEGVPQCHLDQKQSEKYRFLLINSLIEQGDLNQARDLLEKAIAKKPTDLSIQKWLAEVLGNSEDPILIDRALQQYRRLLQQSSKATDLWYEAKYGIANCLFRLGHHEEARQILELMKIVPPGWKDSAYAGHFNTLYQKVNQTKKLGQ